MTDQPVIETYRMLLTNGCYEFRYIRAKYIPPVLGKNVTPDIAIGVYCIQNLEIQQQFPIIRCALRLLGDIIPL